ncbi:hypothetical protein LCGC14_1625210 [marine sediment metagenome]|uniref:Uncharacterized protein n=1 Tax=marine sediment metagenome TaxID=412755 RepID=A0A0F9IR96_9ZZZZ
MWYINCVCIWNMRKYCNVFNEGRCLTYKKEK